MNRAASLDQAFSHRIRSGVMAYLTAAEAADFTELAQALQLANNSLSSHLTRLEQAGYIELRRGFLGRKPRTRILPTDAGRQAWALYLDELDTITRT